MSGGVCLLLWNLFTFYIISETDIILQIFVVPIANLFDFFQFISLKDSSFWFVTFKINTNCQHHSWKFSFEVTILEVTYVEHTLTLYSSFLVCCAQKTTIMIFSIQVWIFLSVYLSYIWEKSFWHLVYYNMYYDYFRNQFNMTDHI